MGKSITTIARPRDLELAVPPIGLTGSGMTLRQVAKGFSDWVASDWKRACNVEYRSGPSGPPVSLIIEGGKVWSRGDMRWPAFLVTGDKAEIIDSADHDKVTTAKFAFSAGPWLVRNETVCNISDEVRRGGFTGLMEGAQRERAAIGLRHDGMVVHYATMASTLLELAEVMKDLGCVSAINLDGGGSVGVLEGDKLFGYSVRHVACALMFKEVIEGPKPVLAPVPTPSAPTLGGENMIVCIDPGHGGPDPGAVNPILGLREKDITLEVSKRLAEYLGRAGVQVILTRDKDTDLSPGLDDKEEMRARAKIANDTKADYLVSVHANWFKDPGVSGIEVSYWPGSIRGKALATFILDALHIAGGLPKRRTFEQALLLHNYGNMVTVTAEIGFVSNRIDGVLLGQAAYLDKVALGIAFGILAMRA